MGSSSWGQESPEQISPAAVSRAVCVKMLPLLNGLAALVISAETRPSTQNWFLMTWIA